MHEEERNMNLMNRDEQRRVKHDHLNKLGKNEYL